MDKPSKFRKDRVRDLIWTRIVNLANSDTQFRSAVEPMGMFSFMRLVDTIADSVIEEENAADPLKLEVDRLTLVIGGLESSNARLLAAAQAARNALDLEVASG